jgi:tetratricopeptide (TPR) repeat protein
MSDQLAQRAVQAALKGNWEEAQELNQEIIEKSPNDRDAQNRLARTYFELGKLPKALTLYKQVLKGDPYNTIAQKAVTRLEGLKARGNTKAHTGTKELSLASSFLEEPGKTKTATLIHIGSPEVLENLNVAEEVKLVLGAHRVSVETEEGDLVGRLPDDLSTRIIKLTREGNTYEVRIKSTNPKAIKVFIRELKRGDKVADIPSFPQTDKANYISFTPPDLIHEERPDIETFEDQN